MRTLLAAALLAAALSAPARAGVQDFTLLNNTGYPIAEVYVSASAREDWEEDVLGEDILAEGERARIRFSSEEEACLHDLKVVYADGETAAWQGIDLCELSVVSIRYDRETGETSAEGE